MVFSLALGDCAFRSFDLPPTINPNRRELAGDSVNMDKYIDARFERVEKALATLVDSISKYNPSTATATELLEADAELSKGIELGAYPSALVQTTDRLRGAASADTGAVQVHQNNHLQIQGLRATIVTLDGQIKGILTSLAGVRRELTSTGTGIPDGPSHEIRYDELLSYARRISKTTLPPPGVLNGLDRDGTGTPPSQQDTGAAPTPVPATPAAATPVPQSNGSQTPAGASTPAALSQPPPTTAPGPDADARPPSQLGAAAAAAIPPNIAQFMNPLTGQVFVPWPDAGRFRLGLLAANQGLLDEGLDIRGYDPVAAAQAAASAAEEERLRAEQLDAEDETRARERDAAARDDRVRLMQENSARAGSAAGASGAAGATSAPPPHQFHFMEMDDDEDEDER